jgi:hypothetical protein
LWIGDLKFNFAEGSFGLSQGAKMAGNHGRSWEKGTFSIGFIIILEKRLQIKHCVAFQ